MIPSNDEGSCSPPTHRMGITRNYFPQTSGIARGRRTRALLHVKREDPRIRRFRIEVFKGARTTLVFLSTPRFVAISLPPPLPPSPYPPRQGWAGAGGQMEERFQKPPLHHPAISEYLDRSRGTGRMTPRNSQDRFPPPWK